MAIVNPCVPFYKPGGELTCEPTTAVLGCRFVKISGNLSADGNIAIAPPTAAGRVFGVANRDAAVGEKVTVYTAPGTVLPVFAAAAVAAFAEVEVNAAGAVIPLASGVPVGLVLTAALINTLAKIQIY